MVELFANSEDTDQMLCSAVSDLGLHCLPVTRLGVSHLQWGYGFVCVVVLRPSQPNGVMSSAVSLPNHTFTGQGGYVIFTTLKHKNLQERQKKKKLYKSCISKGLSIKQIIQPSEATTKGLHVHYPTKISKLNHTLFTQTISMDLSDICRSSYSCELALPLLRYCILPVCLKGYWYGNKMALAALEAFPEFHSGCCCWGN